MFKTSERVDPSSSPRLKAGNPRRADLIALLGTAAVVVLPGWEQSNGARLEVTVARALGMLIWEYEPQHTEAAS